MSAEIKNSSCWQRGQQSMVSSAMVSSTSRLFIVLFSAAKKECCSAL
ncbi:Uncharacterised protein [Vibrio cholerae]|nr:Uncharacterised protein [Vibrio cholerae]